MFIFFVDFLKLFRILVVEIKYKDGTILFSCQITYLYNLEFYMVHEVKIKVTCILCCIL